MSDARAGGRAGTTITSVATVMINPLAIEAVSALDSSYRPLFDGIVTALAADPRIRAAWLGGSLARGVADVGSDLDLLVAIAAADFDELMAGWQAWLERLCPTVLARRMPGFLFSVTEGGERVDIVCERDDALPDSVFRSRLVVFDRDGLDGSIPAPDPPAGPDPDRVLALVEEFLRQQSIWPAAVVAREDWLLGVVGLHNTHVLLYSLFEAANQPLPPMGVKQWSAKLTDRQRGLLTELGHPGPDREQLIAAMTETRRTFLAEAAAICDHLSIPWPTAFDEAVTGLFTRHGLPI